ncbi:MAG: hypothetical protein Q8P81_03630 [Nanoarchaeota archaeon]|nr:hypothetical protein [Nanoarchaeota archaeon]
MSQIKIGSLVKDVFKGVGICIGCPETIFAWLPRKPRIYSICWFRTNDVCDTYYSSTLKKISED